MSTTREARWHGGLVVAVFVSFLGVILGLPGLFVLAVVPLGFVLVGQLGSEPTASLRIERELDESRPRPGQSVTVTLSVTNVGDGVVPDVRIVDEPPESVSVTAGSPAFATAIRPGETVAHEYTLTPPRGEFEFGTSTVRVRSLTATVAGTDRREFDGASTFRCETVLDSFPLREETIQFVGQTPTGDGGTGIEFFATREYRRGDPINRIDWHRLAKTGELATVEYRQERSVTTVFVIDDRNGVHRNSPEGGPDSYDLTLYAASRGVVASLEDGNRTGLATLTDDVWIEPRAESTVRQRVEETLGTSDSGIGTRTAADGGSVGTDPGRSIGAGTPQSVGADSGRATGTDPERAIVTDLERQLPRRAQVVFCTPVTDSGAVEIVRSLRSRGRAVTVVSPDITTGVETVSVSRGARIAGLERANRIDTCRGLGATVVDWQLDDPISVDLARAFENGGRSR